MTQVAVYCTQTDLQNRLSITGVALRLDDLPPGGMNYLLIQAAEEVNWFCQLSYSIGQLSASNWINQAATGLALFFLATRRGEPAPKSIADEAKRARDRLEQISDGKKQIPDVPGLKANAPVMSNITTRVWPTMHPRVERARSTGRVATYVQRPDGFDPLRFLDPGI